jgi:hypothetical protein
MRAFVISDALRTATATAESPTANVTALSACVSAFAYTS